MKVVSLLMRKVRQLASLLVTTPLICGGAWGVNPVWAEDTTKPATQSREESAVVPTGVSSAAVSDDKTANNTASDAKPDKGDKHSDKHSKHKSAKDKSKDKKKSHYSAASVTSMLTWVDPEKDPKAALLCVHGLGLYNNTYEAFGKAMAKKGYAVFAMDVPGFGSFQNKETHQKIDFDVCLDDMTKTIKLIRRAYPKLPIFVLGESMGGAIVLRYTSEHPELVTGMISCVPSGDRFKQNKEKLRVGLKLLTAPNKPFDIGTGVVERATKKEDLKKAWSEDRLNRMYLSPKDLIRFQNFMNDNHESAKLITKTPVLFVQGCKDKLVRPEGTVSLFNRISCPDKQLELIHDAEHLIFEEGQFDDKVVQIVDTWLSSHITKTTAEQDKPLTIQQ